jgi:FMN phosphatase YigB (HAD superfamily)
MSGTKKMMLSDDPAHNLKEVFGENFYPFLGVDPASVQTDIEEFYDDVFPTIKDVTRPIPGVVEFVDWAFAEGHRVVIATSPYFPRKAQYHRLRWAGLPPEKYPFPLISSYEEFHFTKPNLAYFAEVLGRLGYPDDPVLMVGNDVEADLKPADALGLATYHSLDITPSTNGFTATGSGRIGELKAWLEKTDPAALMPKFGSSQSLSGIQRGIPAALAGLVGERTPDVLRNRIHEDDWSVTEVICHLRDVEREVDQARIRQIMDETEPFIPAQMPDEWAKSRAYQEQDGREALQEFTTARIQTLEMLRGLTPDQWSMKARHSILGPTTLQELVGFNAEHDRIHVQQVWKVLGSQGRLGTV